MAPRPTAAKATLLEPLLAYDLSLWLGSETAAARVLMVSQSTISRSCTRLKHALDLPSTTAIRSNQASMSPSHLSRLRPLRRINQHLRILEHRGLRFQCDQPLSSEQFQALQQHGWILGPRGRWGEAMVAQLVSESVVDVWLPADSHQLLTRRHLPAPEWQQPRSISNSRAPVTSALHSSELIPLSPIANHVDLHQAIRAGRRLP